MELVTIFDSTNPALVGIAKTVLEAASIEFLVVGDDGAEYSPAIRSLGASGSRSKRSSLKKPKRSCPRSLKAWGLSTTNRPCRDICSCPTKAARTNLSHHY